ncbi:MAG: fibrobacter succinogenes major paralogous domain-containing protein [Tannerella sp.]|jgi:hypothetical protein|nr:fibrobacter succinogenes major paralogous domain-containing protein [Tannerella sp.]
MKKIFGLFCILLALGVLTKGCVSVEVPMDPNRSDNGNDNGNGGGDNGGGEDEKLFFRVKTTAENTFNQDVTNGAIGLFIKSSTSQNIKYNENVTLVNNYKEMEMLLTVDTIVYSFAYFPYSSSLSNDNKYSGNTSTQDQAMTTSITDIPSSIKSKLLMVSTSSGNINMKNDIAKIQFKNVFSLLRFEIKANAELLNIETFRNQILKRFEMYILDGADSITVGGAYSIDVSQTANVDNNIPTFTDAKKTITAQLSGSQLLSVSTPIVIYIVVPPLSNGPTNKLVVKLDTEDSNNVTYSISDTISGLSKIDRNQLISIPITLTVNDVYTEDVIKKEFKDPANSFIISEPGMYVIPTKKPSGNPVMGSITRADWLWASKAGGRKPDINDLISHISYSDGKIKFQIGRGNDLQEGNVILALKDANNNILWTWHIWITDEPKDVRYEDHTVFMDRNLGALRADMASSGVDNFGLMYQWGRQNPFYGANGLANETNANVMSLAEDNTIINTENVWDTGVNEWSLDYNNRTKDRAERYPMMFLYSLPIADGPVDWLQYPDSALWKDDAKTDSDPCPSGYKVPSMDDMKSIYFPSEYGYSDSVGYFKPKSDGKSWEYYYSGGTTGNLVYAPWPCAGIRLGCDNNLLNAKAGQLILSGATSIGNCYYWTTTKVKIDGEHVAGGSYRLYTSKYTLYSNKDYGNNADAYPVRCVKIKTP